MTDFSTKQEAVTEIDRLISLRWGLLLEGRCPSCEAIIPPPAETTGVVELGIEHSNDCVLLDSERRMNVLADEWQIPLGYAVATKTINGVNIGLVGPTRLTNFNYTD